MVCRRRRHFFWSGGTRNWVVEPTQGATLIVPRRDNGTIRPLRDAEIRAAYGDILVTELVGGQVKLDDNWVTDNIIEMTTPFLQRTGFAKMRLQEGGSCLPAGIRRYFCKGFGKRDIDLWWNLGSSPQGLERCPGTQFAHLGYRNRS